MYSFDIANLTVYNLILIDRLVARKEAYKNKGCYKFNLKRCAVRHVKLSFSSRERAASQLGTGGVEGGANSRESANHQPGIVLSYLPLPRLWWQQSQHWKLKHNPVIVCVSKSYDGQKGCVNNLLKAFVCVCCSIYNIFFPGLHFILEFTETSYLRNYPRTMFNMNTSHWVSK